MYYILHVSELWELGQLMYVSELRALGQPMLVSELQVVGQPMHVSELQKKISASFLNYLKSSKIEVNSQELFL
jgi:hypothetical protein